MSMEKVKALMKDVQTGWLATSDGKAAFLRPMSAWLWDGADLVCSTFKGSDKTAQVQACPGAEFGFADREWNHVRIAGRVTLEEGAEVKKRLFEAHEPLKQFFKGPDDPKHVVLRMKVERVRLLPMESMGYDEVELG